MNNNKAYKSIMRWEMRVSVDVQWKWQHHYIQQK